MLRLVFPIPIDLFQIYREIHRPAPTLRKWISFVHFRRKINVTSELRRDQEAGALSYCSFGTYPSGYHVQYKQLWRTRMLRGLPAYEWWRLPPDEVFLRAYVFNYTNTEAFMNGDADTLKVEEVGPYIFKEKLYHENPTFHENGTMTYTAVRKLIYLPEMNTLETNATILVPNMAVMASASYLAEAPFITKWGFNMMVRRAGSKPFVNAQVWDYFWNFTDPLFDVLASIAPALVPTKNTGILHTVYEDFTDNVTVFTQPSNGDFKFFKIDQYNGSPGLNKYENPKCDSIQGSTEGVHYHQRVNRNDTIYYLRKTICRAVPLRWKNDMLVRGIKAYKFILLNNTYDRPEVPEDECYRDPSYPILPSGVTDVSPCYYS
ncbi:unnamed protein product [Nesidiocoris tenuis]|uniref:Scavenger receptor class B member 1 n=1 Tax=Nesidiocoris tenuis TaxID=355587 RepID=A0A6H5HE96_9HEMI|nr:unnamed protein product [Nesidiocoris tenuis]